MSSNAVECNMHTVHACKVPLDLDIVCDKTVKKFQDMKRRKKVVTFRWFPQVCSFHVELWQSDYLLEEGTQDKASKTKV